MTRYTKIILRKPADLETLPRQKRDAFLSLSLSFNFFPFLSPSLSLFFFAYFRDAFRAIEGRKGLKAMIREKSPFLGAVLSYFQLLLKNF